MLNGKQMSLLSQTRGDAVIVIVVVDFTNPPDLSSFFDDRWEAVVKSDIMPEPLAGI